MIKIILEKFFKKRKESFNDMKNINTSVNDLIFSYSLKSEGKIKELQQLKIDIDKKGENLTLEEKIKAIEASKAVLGSTAKAPVRNYCIAMQEVANHIKADRSQQENSFLEVT